MGHLSGSVTCPRSAQGGLRLGDVNSSLKSRVGVQRARVQALCDGTRTPLNPALSSLPTPEPGILGLGGLPLLAEDMDVN